MMKRFVLAFLLCLVPVLSSARNGEGYRRFDASIRRFLMGGLDTTYIGIPATSWEVPVVGKAYGYNTTISPHDDHYNLKTGAIFEVGAGIGYHGLDAVYTQAIGKNMDFNFEFDYYDNYWGLGINIGNETFDDKIREKTLMLEGYIAFFGNKYSYPAAVYGNYIQKKSAGSPIVAFWYEHMEFQALDDTARPYLDDETSMKLNQGALTAGYGYNFVFLKGKILLNISACVGLQLPYGGLAVSGRAGGMFWLCDNLRISLFGADFFEHSFVEKNLHLKYNTWRTTFAVTYCFGK